MKIIDEIDLNIANFKQDFNVENFGMVNSAISNTITYLYDEKYEKELNQNKNISVVITTYEISKRINKSIQIIVSADPMSLFYRIYMDLFKSKTFNKNSISSSAFISSNAIVESKGVFIEDDVVIEGNVVIKTNVIIKKGSIVRSGAVIGGDGFEVKTVDGKQVVIPHDGKVIIGENVDIGYNTCVDKGMFGRDTIIEDNTKIDNLCHIAHGVQIGKNTKIAAKAMIAGSCTIGANVWIGPGSSISNAIKIGDNSKITIGSTVLRDVEANQTVTGYFAQEHKVFLRQYLNLFRKEKND